MSDQITLIMDCQTCTPSCTWPIPPANTVRVSFALFQNTIFCTGCVALGASREPPFDDINIIPGSIICVFQGDLLVPACTADQIQVITRRDLGPPFPDRLQLTVQIGNAIIPSLWRWFQVFDGPEKFTNGPFLLPIVQSNFRCDTTLAAIATVRGVVT